jgi:hypothetical protein
MADPEYWLRGPVDGVAPLLQPFAHSLLQVREDVAAALARLTPVQIWTTPAQAASVGFHARHLCGSVDRLLTELPRPLVAQAYRPATRSLVAQAYRPATRPLVAQAFRPATRPLVAQAFRPATRPRAALKGCATVILKRTLI